MRGSKTTWAVGSPLSVVQADCLAERGGMCVVEKALILMPGCVSGLLQTAIKNGEGKFGQKSGVVGN